MQCQRCQRQSVPDATFCSYCGEQLSEVCGVCGSASARGSNFCHHCGRSLAASNAAGAPSRVDPQGYRPSLQTRCPRCNALNEPGALYCLECGLPFEGVRTYAGDVPAHVGTPAGFWIRLGAYLVDSLIVIVVQLIIFGISASTTGAEATADDITALDFAAILLGVAYYTFTVAIWSTTAGKRVFSLYVVRPGGSRVGVARAFARYLAYIPSFLLLFAGVIMIGVRRDKRGMHDLIADTVVVKR